ncbi:MAG: TIGR00269 family protein [archaeon]
MLNKSDKVAVAVSGGKDSLTVLSLLSKFGYNVFALAIDEGISGYRDKTIVTMTQFCISRKIKYRIISFKDEFKKSLDSILKQKNLHPCSVCGVFRRYLLNKYSKGYDVIATGHNMDDEAQAVIMNLSKNNLSAMERSGPVSGNSRYKTFTKRIKPLFFCSEKEVMVYSFINNITSDFNECPHVQKSYRMQVRDELNQVKASYETKKNILLWSLDNKTADDVHFDNVCRVCGETSSNLICKTCEMVSICS